MGVEFVDCVALLDDGRVLHDRWEFSTRSVLNSSPTLVGIGYLFATTSWNGVFASETTLAGQPVAQRKRSAERC